MDILDHVPHPAALELLRTGAQKLPDLRELAVPGAQGGVQVVHDPVPASDFYHLPQNEGKPYINGLPPNNFFNFN